MIRESVLSCGVRVLTERIPTVRSATVGIFADVGHAHQPLREAELPGLKERLRQDFPMLCFDAAPMSGRLLAQTLHQRIVQTSDQEISHDHSHIHV